MSLCQPRVCDDVPRCTVAPPSRCAFSAPQPGSARPLSGASPGPSPLRTALVRPMGSEAAIPRSPMLGGHGVGEGRRPTPLKCDPWTAPHFGTGCCCCCCCCGTCGRP
eukprot:728467-Pyramimonas_sp.AAC.1